MVTMMHGADVRTKSDFRRLGANIVEMNRDGQPVTSIVSKRTELDTIDEFDRMLSVSNWGIVPTAGSSMILGVAANGIPNSFGRLSTLFRVAHHGSYRDNSRGAACYAYLSITDTDRPEADRIASALDGVTGHAGINWSTTSPMPVKGMYHFGDSRNASIMTRDSDLHSRIMTDPLTMKPVFDYDLGRRVIEDDIIVSITRSDLNYLLRRGERGKVVGGRGS